MTFPADLCLLYLKSTLEPEQAAAGVIVQVMQAWCSSLPADVNTCWITSTSTMREDRASLASEATDTTELDLTNAQLATLEGVPLRSSLTASADAASFVIRSGTTIAASLRTLRRHWT